MDSSESGSALDVDGKPVMTNNMRISKQLLLDEVERDIEGRSCRATCRTIFNYLKADQQRRPRALRIGIFTVILLVTCITMFKSVIDSSSILFVKIGQDQVGAIDYSLRASNNTSLIKGDVNYYGINPTDNPFEVYTTIEETTKGEVSASKCPPKFSDYDQIRVCNDHIQIANKLNILKVDYFEESAGLEQFWGFVPRWYIPHISLDFEHFDFPVTLTLMIMDVQKENYVEVGYDWPPMKMERG